MQHSWILHKSKPDGTLEWKKVDICPYSQHKSYVQLITTWKWSVSQAKQATLKGKLLAQRWPTESWLNIIDGGFFIPECCHVVVLVFICLGVYKSFAYISWLLVLSFDGIPVTSVSANVCVYILGVPCVFLWLFGSSFGFVVSSYSNLFAFYLSHYILLLLHRYSLISTWRQRVYMCIVEEVVRVLKE